MSFDIFSSKSRIVSYRLVKFGVKKYRQKNAGVQMEGQRSTLVSTRASGPSCSRLYSLHSDFFSVEFLMLLRLKSNTNAALKEVSSRG